MLKVEENQKIIKYLSSLKETEISYPYTKTLAVYSVKKIPFAYLETSRDILRISLRSDRELSKLLREKYEEVLPGQKLNPNIWNTIILSGQLNPEEIQALIDHSYDLAIKTNQPKS